MKKSPRRIIATVTAVVIAAAVAACGGSDETTADTTGADGATDGDGQSSSVEVPAGATLCSVYSDQYQVILGSATPFGEEGWEEEAQELVRLSRILQQLAPAEQADNAEANVGYFRAQADVESAREFIDASNDFNLYLLQTCPA